MYYLLLGPNKSYKILLRTTKYCCVLQTTTRYLSVLQSTISYYPVLQNTTKTHTLHTQTQAHRAIRQIDAKRPWHGCTTPPSEECVAMAMDSKLQLEWGWVRGCATRIREYENQ